MCLSAVYKTRRNVTTGYKVFEIYRTGLCALFGASYPVKDICGTSYEGYNYPEGVWLRSTDGKIEGFGDEKGLYETGFHCFIEKEDADCFKEKEDAERHCQYFYNPVTIRKVYLKKIVASGRQWQSNIVVAKEMFICPESWTDEKD